MCSATHWSPWSQGGILTNSLLQTKSKRNVLLLLLVSIFICKMHGQNVSDTELFHPWLTPWMPRREPGRARSSAISPGLLRWRRRIQGTEQEAGSRTQMGGRLPNNCPQKQFYKENSMSVVTFKCPKSTQGWPSFSIFKVFFKAL